MNIFIHLQQQFEKIKHHKFSVCFKSCLYIAKKVRTLEEWQENKQWPIICNGGVSDQTQGKQWSSLSTRAGCPEKLHNLYPQRLSGSNWLKPWALVWIQHQLCSQQELGQPWIQAQSAAKFKQINERFPSSPLPTKSYQTLQYLSLVNTFVTVQRDWN